MHDNTPRLQWRLGVIEELIKELDGFVRAARIRTNGGKTDSPIAKLYPLEINELEDNEAPICKRRNTVSDDDLGDDDATSVPRRSTRKAAVRAPGSQCYQELDKGIICGPGGCQELVIER